MRSASVACWLLAALAAFVAPAGADCQLRAGDRVALYSSSDDPSVLIWDSRVRLRDYNAASFDEAKALLPHALRIAPATRAVVVSCVPKYVTSPISNTSDDAVGVTILSGPHRGITRWVLASDLRPFQYHKP